MDRQGQILRGPSSIICDETDVAAVWWKPCEYACYWLFMFLKRNMDSEFFGLTWSCWNETLAALTLHLQAILIEYGRWFIIVTGSLKTPRGLCNIFFCLNLKKKLNQGNQTRQIQGNPSPTLTFSIVLVAQDVPIWTIQSLRLQNLSKTIGCYVGWTKTTNTKHTQKKTKWWQM